MDTTLMIGQYVPIVLMVVLTLTLIEAAGAAEYRKLPGIDQRQQTSAKIMQVRKLNYEFYNPTSKIKFRDPT